MALPPCGGRSRGRRGGGGGRGPGAGALTDLGCLGGCSCLSCCYEESRNRERKRFRNLAGSQLGCANSAPAPRAREACPALSPRSSLSSQSSVYPPQPPMTDRRRAFIPFPMSPHPPPPAFMELRLTGKASSQNTCVSVARKAPRASPECGNASNSHSASGPCRGKRIKG